MRSIRRSLLLWFLVLVIVALTVVGMVIDGVVRQAVAGREQAAANLVYRQFEERKQEELDRVDQALMDEARAIAQSAQFLYTNNVPSREPLNYISLSALGFGQSSPLTAYLMATPGPVSWSINQEYVARRQLDDKSLLGKLTEDEHFRDLYQIHTVYRNTLQSKSLGGQQLPGFNRNELSKSLPNWSAPDEVPLPDGTMVRRVVLAHPVFLRFVGPPRRGGPGSGSPGGRGERGERTNAPLPQPQTAPPPRTPPQIDVLRTIPRIYVQTARPMSDVQAKFEEFNTFRQLELQRIRNESAAAVRQTRSILFALSCGAIAMMLVGSLVIISRGLRPVDRLSEAVSQVSEKDFRLPIARNELSAELLPVHGRITATLDALRRAFEREKQAVADISHELRTPVAAMAATIDVSLRKVRTPEQYKTTLEECREINRQLGRLVERVMTLATLDAGNDRSTAQPVDAAALTDECVALIRPLAEAHGLTVSAEIDPGLTLTTDRDKVREVLMNLLHNAVEYTPAGGRIDVTARPAPLGGVTFAVRDTGIGMSPDVKDRIFERFYRADASRTATGVHAGLGLAIVKEYLSRIGGSVAVETKPGNGSTFTVSVPTLSA
jgi:signal transduction histidine kinase